MAEGRCQERIQKAPEIPDNGEKFNQTIARAVEPKTSVGQ